MTLKVEKKQTILNWNLGGGNQDNLKLVMTLAGFKVRDVQDESEAINLVDLVSVSEDEIVCFVIRCSGNKERTIAIFETLKKANFHIPILLVAALDHTSSFRAVQDQIPQGLDVHFCYSNSTLDALNRFAA